MIEMLRKLEGKRVVSVHLGTAPGGAQAAFIVADDGTTVCIAAESMWDKGVINISDEPPYSIEE